MRDSAGFHSIEQGLGHFEDDVLQVWRPNQQCQSTEAGWL